MGDDKWRGKRDGGERMDKNGGQSRGLLAVCHFHELRKDDRQGDWNNDETVRPWPLANSCVCSSAQTPTLEVI